MLFLQDGDIESLQKILNYWAVFIMLCALYKGFTNQPDEAALGFFASLVLLIAAQFIRPKQKS